MLKYDAKLYQAKINQLKGYYDQLAAHLETMNGLRQEMFTFWDDENARTTGEVLNIEMNSVKRTMEQVNDTMIFYQNSLDKLSAKGGAVAEILSEAIGVLGL